MNENNTFHSSLSIDMIEKNLSRMHGLARGEMRQEVMRKDIKKKALNNKSETTFDTNSPIFLKSVGWKSAIEIIEKWNRDNGTNEHPTIAGQLLARLGLHENAEYRFKNTRPTLYSRLAQITIYDELKQRKFHMSKFVN